MIIHGFVFEEGTKPAHEHHLQVFLRSQALFSAVYRDLKITPHNGFYTILLLTNSIFNI
jgi:hypothetical protein